MGEREGGREKESKAQACQKGGREHPNVKQQHGYITDASVLVQWWCSALKTHWAERQFGGSRGALVRPCIPPPSLILRPQQPTSGAVGDERGNGGMRGCEEWMECRAGLERKRPSNKPTHQPFGSAMSIRRVPD